MTEKQLPWPYNLPIWRSFYRATSPDGRRVAQIDPALEMGMSDPTSGLLCVTGGPHIERCSPSFVWSDDSRYLAVPQFSGFLGRARLVVVSFEEKRVLASKITAWHFQPETFSGGQLLVKVNPHRATTSVMTFNIPSETLSAIHAVTVAPCAVATGLLTQAVAVARLVPGFRSSDEQSVS